MDSKDPDIHVVDSECPQPKHRQHAPSIKMECDSLYGWINQAVKYTKISPKMVNPRDLAGNTEEKEEASLAGDTGVNPCFPLIWSEVTSDPEVGSPVATLPDAWHCRVSARTCWPGVSVLWLDGIVSLIFNCYLSIAANSVSEQISPCDGHWTWLRC